MEKKGKKPGKMGLTSKQVADYLGFANASRVRQLCLTGVLKGERVGRDWMIDEAEVKKYAEHKKAAKPVEAVAAPEKDNFDDLPQLLAEVQLETARLIAELEARIARADRLIAVLERKLR